MKGIHVNLEAEYGKDIITHHGFKIKKENYGQSLDHLINSDEFTNTEFSCNCGKFIGRDLLGQKCPSCNSEITLRSLDFKYTGWMDLYPHHVITPIYYGVLKRVIGTNMLRFILGDYKSNKQIEYVDKPKQSTQQTEEPKKKRRKGRVSLDDIQTIIQKIPKAKQIYQCLGHDGFYDKYDEILFACKTKSNEEDIEMLLKDKHKVFTSKVPVYSTAFRPVSKTSESYFYPKINKSYAQMCSVYCSIDDMYLPEERIHALNCFQKYWNEAVDHLIKNEISAKTGLVRSEIVGGTFEFSARGVISLDMSLRDDEITMPVNMLMTLYQYKIAHRIAVRYHTTLEQAYLMINQNVNNDIVYGILQEIVDEGVWVMLLREPTDNLASNELVRVRNFKIGDDTIGISEPVLSGFNADFDGDQLNLFIIPNEQLHLWQQFHHACFADYVNDEIKINTKEWISVGTALITR